MQKSRRGCVYIFQREDGILKIGRTKNSYRRLGTVCNNPIYGGEFIFIDEEIYEDCVRAEKEIHAKIAKYHIGHELYDIPVEDALEAIKEADGHIDKFEEAKRIYSRQ